MYMLRIVAVTQVFHRIAILHEEATTKLEGDLWDSWSSAAREVHHVWVMSWSHVFGLPSLFSFGSSAPLSAMHFFGPNSSHRQ